MKSLVTTAPFLDTKRLKKNEKFPIKIRINYKRERHYISTGFDATEEEFEKINSLNPKGELKKIKMNIIDEQKKIDQIVEKMEHFHFKKFNALYAVRETPLNDNVYSYFERKIKKEERSNLNTSSNYECSMNSLKSFSPRLSFYDITPEFLRKYEQWLLDSGKSISTVGFYLRPLRHIVNNAIVDGVLKREDYPFGINRYTIPSTRNKKKALSPAKLEKLFNHKPIEGSNRELALDFWKFSYLCNGINMKDICNLRWKNIEDNHIRFIREKTKNSNRNNIIVISAYILDETQAIIEKRGSMNKGYNDFLFPIFTRNMNAKEQHKKLQNFTRLVNNNMKKICAELEITENVTTYFARHSFCTMLKRNSVPPEIIKEFVGHTKVATTEIYLDNLEDDFKDNLMNVLVSFNTAV